MCISSENIINVYNFCKNCEGCCLRPHEDAVKYDRTYPALLRAGEDCLKHLGKSDAITYIKILALATYGWMPTILGRHGEMGYGGDDASYKTWDDQISNAVNKIVTTQTVGGGTPSELKNFIDNSYIGLSKFLHFMLPDKFAIWDSNVYRALLIANDDKLFKELKSEEKRLVIEKIKGQYGEKSISNINGDDKKREAFYTYEKAIIEAAEKLKVDPCLKNKADSEEVSVLRCIEKRLFCFGKHFVKPKSKKSANGATAEQ